MWINLYVKFFHTIYFDLAISYFHIHTKFMKYTNISRPSLNTQADAVIHFIKQLNIDMIETLLDDCLTYQDFSKSTFIQKFGVAFDEFIHAGDRELTIINGFCSEFLCNNQCSGYRFSSKSSGLYFDLIIEIEDGQVTDIYECSSFLCLSSDTNANKRVRIDRREIKIKIEKPNKVSFLSNSKIAILIHRIKSKFINENKILTKQDCLTIIIGKGYHQDFQCSFSRGSFPHMTQIDVYDDKVWINVHCDGHRESEIINYPITKKELLAFIRSNAV